MPVFRFELSDADIDLSAEQKGEIDVNVHVYVHPPEDDEERDALNEIATRLGDNDGRAERQE